MYQKMVATYKASGVSKFKRIDLIIWRRHTFSTICVFIIIFWCMIVRRRMEVKVTAVASIETCFVSLPLFLIQTLESTRSDSLPLPPLLAIELRHGDRLWHVSWSGSASSSSDIEVLILLIIITPQLLFFRFRRWQCKLHVMSCFWATLTNLSG